MTVSLVEKAMNTARLRGGHGNWPITLLWHIASMMPANQAGEIDQALETR